jgi:uncharacterized membrane protein YtjA (UPF0391 family)
MSIFLKWAVVFFIISMVAAAFGFTGIAEGATEIAQILFYIFIAIFLSLLIAGIVLARKVS